MLGYLIHVLHPLEHVDFSGIFSSLTLPSDGSEGDVGGEEEEETNEGEQGDDQGGQVKAWKIFSTDFNILKK